MKKTTLSQLMSFNAVKTLSIHKLHGLKGGCGGGEYPSVYPVNDRGEGDDENGCNGGGEEGFIPPPGA